MKIFVFGSSITSSYWNGAATYYRGIYKSMHALGHDVTFAEPAIYGRQEHRDAGDYSYVGEIVYQNESEIPELIGRAADADMVIKHSGVGASDTFLEEAVLECGRRGKAQVAFWDVDAPATLARIEADASDPFRPLISQYDFIFTYGGGLPVIEKYKAFGARNCFPIYNALDPESHHPVEPDPQLECDLVFVGNRLPDREKRFDEFFLRAAMLAPDLRFLLGGEGWKDKALPPNVRWIGHVKTGDHNVINSSVRMVLNINRESMAHVGFSPPTRVFEAAGSGACLITDYWPGIEEFFEVDREILVANSAEEIVALLRSISPDRGRQIGLRMRQRALTSHTYEYRARDVDQILAVDRIAVGDAA